MKPDLNLPSQPGNTIWDDLLSPDPELLPTVDDQEQIEKELDELAQTYNVARE
ncbi:hypothetical protein K6V78_06955 [Streptococcus gallolyticus]|nr:hypothetical protein [Streptococcus gallolyticus]MBY5041048.1 hypothetical protein [Streptococcus gallolyticus]